MDEWMRYRRIAVAEMRPVRPGETFASLCAAGVSISQADSLAGSPREGDMVARNPKNHADQWLVAKDYFGENFEPVEATDE